MKLHFGAQFYPIPIDQEDYDNGVDSKLLDEHASRIMEDFRQKIASLGLFSDIFLIPKESEVFQAMAEEIRAKNNLHLMRLIAIDIPEAGIDYLDSELEEYYDYNRERFVSYSKYFH